MKAVATYQKLRGGYYTPKPIADFLAHWAIQAPDAQILEPSCGDGVLLQAAVERLAEIGVDNNELIQQLHGVEFDPLEALKAIERVRSLTGLPPTNIHNEDFFTYCRTHLLEKRYFDAVIGNPPFVRYQNFPEEHRNSAFYLMQHAGLHPTRLTNSWVPFLVASTLLLKDKGRLAMVIPAELLQVNYTAEVRYFLSRYYRSIALITFKKLVFNGIQQEVVLFLGERNGGEHTGIRTIELEGVNDLDTSSFHAQTGPSLSEDYSQFRAGNQYRYYSSRENEKWRSCQDRRCGLSQFAYLCVLGDCRQELWWGRARIGTEGGREASHSSKRRGATRSG